MNFTSPKNGLCWACALVILTPLALIWWWVASSLAHIANQAEARGNPVNLLVAHSIIPRAGGRVGSWQRDEMQPRVSIRVDQNSRRRGLYWQSGFTVCLRVVRPNPRSVANRLSAQCYSMRPRTPPNDAPPPTPFASLGAAAGGRADDGRPVAGLARRAYGLGQGACGELARCCAAPRCSAINGRRSRSPPSRAHQGPDDTPIHACSRTACPL